MNSSTGGQYQNGIFVSLTDYWYQSRW